jgi:hypothetical protein
LRTVLELHDFDFDVAKSDGWMEGSCKEIQLKTDYVTEDRLMQLQTIKPEKKGSRQKILEN